MQLAIKRNVGKVDRVLRIVLGLVFLYSAAFQAIALSAIWTTILLILGIMFLAEGALGY